MLFMERGKGKEKQPSGSQIGEEIKFLMVI